jgi:hypothetical protein
MKIHIGPYPEQHLRSKLLDTYKKDYFADPVTRFEKFLDKADICFQFILNYTINPILARRKRKVKVHIDDYDVWGAGTTLAQVIHPVLVKLKEKKKGAPWTYVEDVPEHLRSTVFAKKNEWVTNKNFARWDWIMSEMIWAFEQELNEEDCFTSDPEIEKRKQNGRRLFAKYYNGLWD